MTPAQRRLHARDRRINSLYDMAVATPDKATRRKLRAEALRLSEGFPVHGPAQPGCDGPCDCGN